MKWICLALAVGLAGNASAEQAPECEGDDSYRLLDILDPDADLQVRQEQLERLRTQLHCDRARRSLGLLYRHGPDLPGNLVERDISRARELLLQAAQSGDVTTFSDLAEMALKEGQAREAMKWTQVYLYFVKQRKAFDPTSGGFERSGYNADLLLRAERAWRASRPRLDRAVRTADFNEYLRVNGEAVLAAINAADAEIRARLKAPVTADEPRVRHVGTCNGVVSRSAGYASYIVQVLPSGKTGKVVLENFSPAPSLGKALRSCANVYEYHPLNGAEPVEVRIPVFFGYQGGAQIKVKGKGK